ncbi:MAG: hypothetical protein M0C28_02840 [Candidatus Moduliflexus flocculans]|nr:hypothetical protein [Candidatus Moduliflexus flocculans]
MGGSEISVTTSYEPVVLTDFSAELKVVLPQRRRDAPAPRPQARHGRPATNTARSISSGRRARSPGSRPAPRAAPCPGASRRSRTSTGRTANPWSRPSSASAGAPLITLSTTYDSIRIKEGTRKF